ncbi:MAG: hypothetical protein K0R41_3673 [Geminicoccaceae bacterium]|nr:hypothetical protein [Geminicoccaceae bacterium]
MRAAVQVRGSVDLEGVLRVIDRAYAAACDETSWDRFVAEVVRLGGFGGCALGSIDPLAPRPVLRAAYGLRDLAPTGAATGRLPRNPLLTDEVLRSLPGTVWHDRQVIAPPLLAATRFWTDWMEPNGFASWACIILGRERTEVAYLEVYGRPGGPSTGCDRNGLLGQLAPHLTRAWRLGKAGRAGPGAARLSIVPAAGASLPSMAKAFDVKLTTVRSQLQQVFAKTGTSRQAELVAVLLSHGYADPTAGRFAPPPEAAGQRSGEGPERLSA